MCTIPLRGCVNHVREPVWCQGFGFNILAFGLNNMLPSPAWYGCSITLLLESVDFTGRMKMSRRGLIETAAVCGCAGERLIPFPVLSILSSRVALVLLLGVVSRGLRLSATLLAPYGPQTMGACVYALGDQ